MVKLIAETVKTGGNGNSAVNIKNICQAKPDTDYLLAVSSERRKCSSFHSYFKKLLHSRWHLQTFSPWAPGLCKSSQFLKPVNWISSFHVTAVICYTLSLCLWASGSWKIFRHIKACEALLHRRRYIWKRVALTSFLFPSSEKVRPLLCCHTPHWLITFCHHIYL